MCLCVFFFLVANNNTTWKFYLKKYRQWKERNNNFSGVCCLLWVSFVSLSYTEWVLKYVSWCYGERMWCICALHYWTNIVSVYDRLSAEHFYIICLIMMQQYTWQVPLWVADRAAQDWSFYFSPSTELSLTEPGWVSKTNKFPHSFFFFFW